MSAQKPRLADFPQAVATLLPVLEQMYPAATFSDPKQMMGEDSRLSLAAEAGKHQVVLEFRAAAALAARELKKEPVREEIA